MADRHQDDRSDNDGSAGEPSVFDLFEPPPTNDPNSFGKVPVIKDSEIDLNDPEQKAAADVEAAGLQHWTAPPTGQVPAILSEKDQKAGLWGDVAGPSWHGDDPTWSGPDLADVFADTEGIRLDDHADEEDDEEEDDEHRRPAARPVRSRPPEAESSAPAQRPVAPPLAAAPERREPRSDRSWPASEPEPTPRAQPPRRSAHAGDPAAGVPSGTNDRGGVPRLRNDPVDGPDPRPGAGDDRATWPTSPDPRARLERPEPATGRATPPEPATDPSSADRARPSSLGGADREPPVGPAARRSVRSDRPSPGHRDRSIPSIDDIEFAEPEPTAQRPAGRAPALRAERPPAGPGPDDGRVLRSRGDGGRSRRPDPDPDFERDLDRELDGLDLADVDRGRPPSSGGRNLPVAVGVGAALVAILLAAMRFGPETTLLLVVVAAVVGVVELYNAMRLAGLRPANLLGIVGTAAAPAAAFYRGDAAFTLIVGLTVVFGFLWYLVGADSERPVLNLSLTMMGILWIGGLAGFAGLMLRADGGVELLLAAIIITVASDTMAYFGGRAYGSRPFHSASPNKTWEGTMTGFAGAVFAGFVVGVTEMGTLWDGNLVPAIALGAVVGLLAPIGDLAESVVKRDLGIKDMGHLLPGHGGVLDRVDALLFALPGAYYLAVVSGLI